MTAKTRRKSDLAQFGHEAFLAQKETIFHAHAITVYLIQFCLCTLSFLQRIMAYKSGFLERPARSTLLERIVGFIIACGLFSLICVSSGRNGQLRKTYSILSKQAGNYGASTGDEQPDGDTPLYNVASLYANISSPATFPKLPPPDNEEYMAICMAGESPGIAKAILAEY